jgi:hypothetical protein
MEINNKLRLLKTNLNRYLNLNKKIINCKLKLPNMKEG